jgi:RNA polymerase sigma-70 factor (ECF subfamily)
VQEAFIQIWQKAGTFDASVGSARAWIYTIARNKALNMVRDGSREDLVDAEGMDRLHEPGIMIGDAVERLAADSRLRHCLETIEPRKRDSILLSYVAGFSHGEIAGLLGVPVGTAKSWVKRGVAALRDCVS